MVWLFLQIWLYLLIAFIAGCLVGWRATRRATPLEHSGDLADAPPIVAENDVSMRQEPSIEAAKAPRRPRSGDEKKAADAAASWTRGTAGADAISIDDDLTQIIGVDDATADRLAALGVTRLKDIAAWDEASEHWIEAQLEEPGRVTRERWTEQARGLVGLD